MNKQRVVFIVPSAICGGHEFQTVEIIKEHCQGEDDSPLVLAGNDDFVRLLDGLNCHNRIKVDFPQGNIIRLFLKIKYTVNLLRQYIKFGDKIIIAGGTVEPVIYYGFIVKYLLGMSSVECVGYIPMYVDKRLLRPTFGCIHNVLIDFSARIIDRYITINKIQAKIIKSHFKRPVAIIKNRVASFPRVTADFGPRLVYCGRLDDGQKNVTQLIRMLDDIRNPYRTLLIIGDGPAKERITSTIAQCQHLHVKMLGWLSAEAMQSILGINDVLVMNSRWEGEPLVVREFASRGIPAIAPDIPGFRTVIKKQYRFACSRDIYGILARFYSL
ncbi:glycosyltransferase [Aeromonas veronii]